MSVTGSPSCSEPGPAAVRSANRLVIVPGSGLQGRLEGGPGDPVVFRLGEELARGLVEVPSTVRYRYEVP